MKRLAVFSLLVAATMILAACIGTGQATVNPNPTASQSNAGVSSDTAVPSSSGTGLESTAVSSLPGNTQSTEVPSTGMSTSVGTGLGNLDVTVYPTTEGLTLGTLVPNTGSPYATGEANGYTPAYNATSEAYNSNPSSNIPSTGGQAQGAPTQNAVVPNTGSNTGETETMPLDTPMVTNNLPTAESSTGAVVSGTAVPNTGATTSQTGATFIRLQSLMNYSLTDSTGASLGSVNDFVINLVTTRVDYLVVSSNGRMVLVPWSAVSSISDNNKAFMFSYDSSQFQNAPTFNQAGTDFSSSTWNQDVNNYWAGSGSSNSANAGAGTATANATGTTGIVPNAVAVLFSQFMNVQVTTPGFANGVGSTGSATSVPNSGTNQNIVLGTVQDAVVNRSTGEMPYILITVNIANIGLDNRLIPVPLNVLRRDFANNTMYLSITLDALRNAPNFDATNLPNNLGFGWDMGILNYWTGGMLQSTPTTQP